MLDAKNFAMQFNYSFASGKTEATHMGVLFRTYFILFNREGDKINWELYRNDATKTLTDSGTLQPDLLPANTLLVVLYQEYLLVYLDGDLVVAKDGISKQRET